MIDRRCPECRETIARPAREGGLLIAKPPYVRVTDEGAVILACPNAACGQEIRFAPTTPQPRRLVIPRA